MNCTAWVKLRNVLKACSAAAGAPAGWLPLVVPLVGLMLISGCGDESKFRPKVGGGLKRDAGDEPAPASVPNSPGSPVTAQPAATGGDVAMSRTQGGEPPAPPSPPSAGPTNSSPPGGAPVFRPRRPAARRPGADGAAPASQMQLECNGKVLIRPLVLRPVLQAPGRKTVWLLTSSADEERATSPAVCLRFETEGEDPEAWVGRPWSGQMFVQIAGTRQIFGTALEGEVRVEFSVWDAEGAEGRILPGELQSATGDKPVPYEGTFVATTQVATAPEGESE